jgi:hypothetical protein
MKKIILFYCTCLHFAMAFSKTPVNNHSNNSASTGNVIIRGTLYAPGNTKIVLQNNGKDDLVLVTGKESAVNMSKMSFQFLKPLLENSPYHITVKSLSSGLICKINRPQGVASNLGIAIEVVCESKFDLVSRSKNDSALSTYYESTSPVISGALTNEGRYVAFVSSSSGFAGSTGKHRQIFWRDRNTGETKLISKAADGQEGNGDSFAPAMDISGKKLVFESYASNLVAADANAVRDVFLWEATTGEISRISAGPGGTEANAESYEPTIGANGLIAFTSNASNLTDGVSGTSTANIYFKNRDVLELISKDPETNKGVGGSRPCINDLKTGATLISFCSSSSKLTPNDNNGLWDIFLYNQLAPLKRISLTNGGGERNQGTESTSRVVSSSISGDGRFVAFATTATNMVPDDNNNAQDVFVVNVEDGKVIRASVDSFGHEGNADSPIGQGEKIAINYDGRWTAFSSKATNLGAPESNIIAHNMVSGKTIAISSEKGSSVGTPSMSMKASYIVFGMGSKLDLRFPSSGIFAAYTDFSGSRFIFQPYLNNQ